MIKSRNSQYTAEYRYDALGRRIQKRSKHHHTGQEQNIIYGWDGNTLAYESNEQITKHYIYEKDSFVPLAQAVYAEEIELHQTPDWADKPYSLQRDPLWKVTKTAKDFKDFWFYHCDHLGTPQEMTDHTGSVIWKAEYKAWGECKAEKAKSNFFEDSEIISNNIRFQGQYFDQETGLHYNRYRYYSPYVGRFISKDPIRLLGGDNVYAYAPNPVEWVDPLGLNSTSKNSEEEMIRVRHYTNRKGSNAIEETQKIIAADNNRVYVEPANRKPLSQIEAENKYQIKRGKGRDYVEFDVQKNKTEWVKNPRYHDEELTIKGGVDNPCNLTVHRRK